MVVLAATDAYCTCTCARGSHAPRTAPAPVLLQAFAQLVPDGSYQPPITFVVVQKRHNTRCVSPVPSFLPPPPVHVLVPVLLHT